MQQFYMLKPTVMTARVNKPPIRKHLDIKKESMLNQLKCLLEENSITVEVYFSKILHFYDFNRRVERPEDEDSDEVNEK